MAINYYEPLLHVLYCFYYLGKSYLGNSFNVIMYRFRLYSYNVNFHHFSTYSKINKNCIVYNTQVTDPYTNLAFEEWMQCNVDFSNNHCLFLWQSIPSIVIGKHQNPWKECKINKISENKINLCRRNSGGGTVYHDLGNLNITFFTDRQSYNRAWNLHLIVEALTEEWPQLDLQINKRDDIMLNGCHKISGTSAKLGKVNAYHHCTLLVNSHKRNIFEYINKEELDVNCKATSSVLSPIANLSDVVEDISINKVKECISRKFLEKHSCSKCYEIDTGNETLLEGISKLVDENSTWEWIYGKTPKFYYNLNLSHKLVGDFEVILEIKNGKISDIALKPINMEIKQNFCNDLKKAYLNTKLLIPDVKSVLKVNQNLSKTEFIQLIGEEIIKKLS